MIGIYKIENKLNGKVYIGQSINIEARWKRHVSDSSNHLINEQSAVIHKAINKYGLENFSFVVLEECNIEELDEREIYWISYYNSYYNGYNCTKGGSRNTDHFKKKVYCYDVNGIFIEEFESVNEAAEKLNILPLSISNCCLGKTKSSHNLQFSYENKKKEPLEQVLGCAKRVGQFTKSGELIMTYPSASAAARAMNLTKYSIADCCRGRQKTSAGYIWKYI